MWEPRLIQSCNFQGQLGYLIPVSNLMLVYAIKLKKKKEKIYQQIHMYIDFEAKKLLYVKFSNFPL